MSIEQAQASLWGKLLEQSLANKPTFIQQIDIEHEGDEVVAWVYFQPADDDCFAVSFKPPAPMLDDEVRNALIKVAT